MTNLSDSFVLAIGDQVRHTLGPKEDSVRGLVVRRHTIERPAGISRTVVVQWCDHSGCPGEQSEHFEWELDPA